MIFLNRWQICANNQKKNKIPLKIPYESEPIRRERERNLPTKNHGRKSNEESDASSRNQRHNMHCRIWREYKERKAIKYCQFYELTMSNVHRDMNRNDRMRRGRERKRDKLNEWKTCLQCHCDCSSLPSVQSSSFCFAENDSWKSGGSGQHNSPRLEICFTNNREYWII